MAGDPACRVKFLLPALVRLGFVIIECESCELAVFQLAKVYAVPPQLNEAPGPE